MGLTASVALAKQSAKKNIILPKGENEREAPGEENPPVITPLFMPGERFLLIGCFKPRDVRRE